MIKKCIKYKLARGCEVFMRFEVKQWMTKPNGFNKTMNGGNPMPMRVMFGEIVKTTEKAYVVKVHGKPEPSTHCMHCRRKLTHKVSMFYGLGPVCGQHFYISGVTEENLDKHFQEIRRKLSEVVWYGFIPKSAVNISHETLYEIVFSFDGKEYKVSTKDETSLEEIKLKADKIISINTTKC